MFDSNMSSEALRKCVTLVALLTLVSSSPLRMNLPLIEWLCLEFLLNGDFLFNCGFLFNGWNTDGFGLFINCIMVNRLNLYAKYAFLNAYPLNDDPTKTIFYYLGRTFDNLYIHRCIKVIQTFRLLPNTDEICLI